MSLALEKSLTPAAALPEASLPLGINPRVEISVIFTSVACTIAALKRAAILASQLEARISLLVPQVVPYPLPLTSPPVLLAFNERKFRMVAAESPVETRVQIYLCREPFETVEAVLARRSIVVVGGRKRWWLTREQRLARRLRKSGHEVIFTEPE